MLPPSSGWKYHHGVLTTAEPSFHGKQKRWPLAELFDAAIHLDKDLLPNAVDLIGEIANHAVNQTFEQEQELVAAEWLGLAIESGSLPLLKAFGPELPWGFVWAGTSNGKKVCKAAWKVGLKLSSSRKTRWKGIPIHCYSELFRSQSGTRDFTATNTNGLPQKRRVSEPYCLLCS